MYAIDLEHYSVVIYVIKIRTSVRLATVETAYIWALHHVSNWVWFVVLAAASSVGVYPWRSNRAFGRNIYLKEFMTRGVLNSC